MTTSPGVHLDAFDVLPKWIGIQSGFKRAIAWNDAHCFDSILIFQVNFECLVTDPILQGSYISFVFFSKDSLRNQEIWKLIRKDVDLEPDWVASNLATSIACWVDNCQGHSLDDLCSLCDLRAVTAIHRD